jgi:DNA-binding CsgD family transcriptional regulator
MTAADTDLTLDLVGRAGEQRMLSGLLAGVGVRGAALVVRGEPGIGKSALVGEAVRAGACQGMLVLGTSGVQPEAGLAFAGLHQLLRPVLGHLAGLPPRQRAALGAAFGTADADTAEPFLIGLAALQLLSEAAAKAPVVLVAEDAQWLDRPTAEALAFIARRVESDPVLLLAAIRDGYRSPLLDAGLPELRLAGLGKQPAQDLLTARHPRLAPAARGRVAAQARGNPLALIELPAALASGARVSTAAPGRLPLTERLERAFAARAAELDPLVQTLLLLAAADDSSAPAQVMKAAGLVAGAEPTVEDLVPAIEANLIEAGEQVLRFGHPLVRSAVYQAADVATRHAAHAALAEVLTDDPDRQAWHRAAAAASPDPAVSADLAEAARRARDRGGISTAAAAFERAAALSPDPARRGALLLRAAEADRELGRPDLVRHLLTEAGAQPLSPRDRAYAMALADAIAAEPVGDPVRIGALAEAARQVTAGEETGTALALDLLSAAAFRCYWAGLGGPSAAAVLTTADQAGADPGDPLLLQIKACADPHVGRPAVLERLAAATPPDDPEALYLLGTASCLSGDFHRAHSLLGTCLAPLREQERLRVLTHATAVRAWAAIMTSDYQAARAAAEEAGRLATETAQPLWGAANWTAQAALAALNGDQPAVDRLTARVEEIMLPVGGAAPLAVVQYARGLLALGQGRHADAYDELHRIYQPGDPACNHRNQLLAIGELAEAAILSGHREHARQLLEHLRPLAGRAPWPRAATRYAAALLADNDRAEAAFQDVLDRDLPAWPFTRARLHLVYGEWLRRQRRPADSRKHLRAARDAFDALGTAPWSERAGRELRASGETSRRSPGAIDQLTPQERHIIELASDGLSNREIGQRLCLSHRTVESHLYRVFPKLGVTSRSQLAVILTRVPAQRGR